MVISSNYFLFKISLSLFLSVNACACVCSVHAHHSTYCVCAACLHTTYMHMLHAYYIHAHGGQRTIFIVSPCLPPCLRRGLLFEAVYVGLAGLWAPRNSPVCLSSHGRKAGTIKMCYWPGFMCVLGIQTHVLTGVRQVLYLLSRLPSLGNSF